jgi:hypothetical protein
MNAPAPWSRDLRARPNAARISKPLAACAMLGLCAILGVCTMLTSCGGNRGRAAHVWEPDSIPDAFAHPTAALFWPGLPRSFLVDPDGALQNGLWRVRFEIAAGGVNAAPPLRIAYEQRWNPVVRWTRWSDGVRWDFEAVAFPARGERDSVLAVSVEVVSTNTASAPCETRLEAVMDAGPNGQRFVAPDGDTPAAHLLEWAASGARDSSCGVASVRGDGASAGETASLRAGERRTTTFVLSSHAMRRADLEACARTPHAVRADQVREFWRGAVDRGTQFALGDPETEDAVRAAKVVLLGCRERNGDRWLPIGGPFQYRDTWIRDGARMIEALAVTGETAEARQLADGLAALQWPQGAFLTQRGQLDGTGQALWAFEQAALRPEPAPNVADLASRALRSCQWVEAQRNVGRSTGWPFGAMLPFADPRDGELARAQLVGNDLWMLAGYRAAARLCGAAGRPADSARIEAARLTYANDIANALARTHSPDVPPCWQGNGRDWGNLAAAWPTGALSAADARCERLARRVWAPVGGAGFVCYGDPDSLQSYVGADLGVWAMLADRARSADSVRAALLHWRDATGAGAEIFSRSTRDFGANLPPHPTSAAALLTLVRDAIVFDDGDTLELTLGAPKRWWRNGRIERAPTRWGTIDVTFAEAGNHAHWTWTRVPVWTELRVSPGTVLAAAPVPPLTRGRNAHFLLAPPGTSAADAELTTEPAPR